MCLLIALHPQPQRVCVVFFVPKPPLFVFITWLNSEGNPTFWNVSLRFGYRRRKSPSCVFLVRYFTMLQNYFTIQFFLIWTLWKTWTHIWHIFMSLGLHRRKRVVFLLKCCLYIIVGFLVCLLAFYNAEHYLDAFYSHI